MDNRETKQKEVLAYQAFRLRVEEALKKLTAELNGINQVKDEPETPSA